MTDNPINSSINRDFTFDSIEIKRSFQIPLLSVPEKTLVGGLAFDKDTKKVNYSDGVEWLPLGGDSGGGELNPKAIIQAPIGLRKMYPAGSNIYRVTGLVILYDQDILSSVNNSLGYSRIYFNATGTYIINVTINYAYSSSTSAVTTNHLFIERSLVTWYPLIYQHDPAVNEVLANGTFPKYVITDISQYLTIAVHDIDVTVPNSANSVDQISCCIQITKA